MLLLYAWRCGWMKPVSFALLAGGSADVLLAVCTSHVLLDLRSSLQAQDGISCYSFKARRVYLFSPAGPRHHIAGCCSLSPSCTCWTFHAASKFISNPCLVRRLLDLLMGCPHCCQCGGVWTATGASCVWRAARDIEVQPIFNQCCMLLVDC